MNNCNFIGRLTADPELRRTQSGVACCSFSMAVKRPRVKDTTDFLNFVVWQQGAEYLCQYGHKGDIVGATGSLTTRSWEDKDGKKRTSVEVSCDSVELLSSKKSSEASGNPAQSQKPSYGQPSYAQQNFQNIDTPDAQLPF